MGIKEDVVKQAVLYIQQEYETLGGPDKLQKAIAWATAQLNAKGIQVTPDEIAGLIGTALKLLKKDFGDERAKQVDTPPAPVPAPATK